MGINIALTGLVLFLFSWAVIRTFSDVESIGFRGSIVALFLLSAALIPVGLIVEIWL